MELITKSKGFENSGIVYTSRVLKVDGTPVVQSDLTSVTFRVYAIDPNNPSDPGTLIVSPTVTVAGSVYNTLQTDPTGNTWTDDTGWNFRVAVDEAAFPEGNATYRLEFKFQPVSGSYFYAVHEHTTLPIYSE